LDFSPLKPSAGAEALTFLVRRSARLKVVP
jgi:hypothetical protein